MPKEMKMKCRHPENYGNDCEPDTCPTNGVASLYEIMIALADGSCEYMYDEEEEIEAHRETEDRAESRFADVWRERNRIQPEIMNDRVDNDWAKGRNQFLTFLIRIRDEKLIMKINEIQDRLSTIPCVDPFPKDYFHITVKGCGFLAKSEKHEDDILIENLQKIVSQTKEVLQTFYKFNAVLSKLNIFSEVVSIEVHDEGKIGELNKGLQAIPEIKKMKFDYPNLLPHISIAQFQNNQEFARLISYLEKLRETEFGELTVSYVELVNAHLSGKYPILKTMHAFRLR